MNLGRFVLGKFATSELRRFASHILYLEVLLCDFARFFFFCQAWKREISTKNPIKRNKEKKKEVKSKRELKK